MTHTLLGPRIRSNSFDGTNTFDRLQKSLVNSLVDAAPDLVAALEPLQARSPAASRHLRLELSHPLLTV